MGIKPKKFEFGFSSVTVKVWFSSDLVFTRFLTCCIKVFRPSILLLCSFVYQLQTVSVSKSM